MTRTMLEERGVVGGNVLRLRRERNWTQSRLSAESGVNTRTIRTIERERRGAHEGTLIKLAAAFRLADVDELFTPYDPTSPPSPAPPPPVQRHSPAREAFSRDVDELRRAVARLAMERPAAGDITYRRIGARIRTLTAAVQKERRAGRNSE